jgi:hypothetical protein
MKICIVVARYNEDVSWTKQFNNNNNNKNIINQVNVLIYNKGEKLEDGYNVINLDNKGREGHSYYKYIIDNYYNLDDYIIFLQGNPFDHSPNIIKNIYKYLNNKFIFVDFNYLSEWIIDCNLNGCIHHPELPLIPIYNKLFNIDKEEMAFQFGAGAQFIVSKNSILKRQISFFNKIVELLEYDINPIEGFVMERFHKIIFTNID